MSTFRKKPVVIEAAPCRELIFNAENNWLLLPQWFRDAYEKGGIVIAPRLITIKTLEGTMAAELDDWVICGVKGEMYPCKPDIFAMTYEAVAVEKSELDLAGIQNEAKTKAS